MNQEEFSRKCEDLVNVFDHIQTLEDQKKAAKKKFDDMEAELVPHFKEAKMDRVTHNGATVWLNRKIWASSDRQVPVVAQALKDSGVEELVTETVNATRLTSWVREFDPDECLSPEEIRQKLPPEIQESPLKISEVFKLGVTRSK